MYSSYPVQCFFVCFFVSLVLAILYCSEWVIQSRFLHFVSLQLQSVLENRLFPLQLHALVTHFLLHEQKFIFVSYFQMKGLAWSSECVDWQQQVPSMAAPSTSNTSQLKTLVQVEALHLHWLWLFLIGISAEQLRQIFTSHILQGRDRHFGHLIHS